MKYARTMIFWGGEFDYNKLNDDLILLKLESETPNIWNNSNINAKEIFKEISIIEKKVKDFKKLENSLNDLQELYLLSHKENDLSSVKDLLIESDKILGISIQLRYLNLMNGEADLNNCFLEIHAGAGGTESQDWAEILQRMYMRWGESKSFKISKIQENRGEEAGIKSSIYKISGEYSYGWLKNESGIHRLVRISPFDSNKRRHTSFASVWVYPEIDEKIDIEINESQLRIDTFRASGAGGQHVNTTDSAIRITHLDTGIVVQCQSDRSQHKNKSIAMALLKSRLYEVELQKRKSKENTTNSLKKDIGWGNQIRSYVLHPYKLVKDSRTNYETSNTNDILDGKIDDFLERSLTLQDS